MKFDKFWKKIAIISFITILVVLKMIRQKLPSPAPVKFGDPRPRSKTGPRSIPGVKWKNFDWHHIDRCFPQETCVSDQEFYCHHKAGHAVYVTFAS